MGFMDKAKEAAQQAKAQAQQLAQQGQAKVATIQQGRSEHELLRALGEAVYAEQRHGGDHRAVADALTALDEHYAAASKDAAKDAPATGDSAPADAPAKGDPAPPAGAPTDPPAGGSFTLDQL